MKGKLKFNIEYNHIENQLKLETLDFRSVSDRYYGHVAEFDIFDSIIIIRVILG